MSVAVAPRLRPLGSLGSLGPLGRCAPVLAPLVAGALVLALYAGNLPLVATAVVAAPVLLTIAVRPEWGVAVVLAAAPFISVALPLGPEGSVQPLRGALPLLALWSIAQGIALEDRPSARTTRPRAALLLAVLTALTMMALSAMLAVEPVGALHFLPEFCTAVLAFFAAAQVARRPHGLERVLLGAVVGLLVAGGYGLVQTLTGAASGGAFYVDGSAVERVQASFPHPNFFATYLVVLIPVAGAVPLSRAFRPGLRAVAVLAGAVGAVALVLTYSRGPVIGLIAGGFVWLLLVRPRQTLSAAAILAVAVLVVAPSQVTERFAGAGVPGDVALRGAIWRGALDVFSQHPSPVRGSATSPMPTRARQRSKHRPSHRPAIGEVGGDELPPTAHNVYLNVPAEQGAIGLAIYLMLGTIVLTRSARAARPGPADAALGAGVGIAVAAWAAAGVVDTIPFCAGGDRAVRAHRPCRHR